MLFTASSENLKEAGLSSVVTEEPTEKVYLNSFCFGLRFHENIAILPAFSKFLFRDDSIRSQIIKTANGVTRFNISKTNFQKIKIPLPPLPTQKAIADFLDEFSHATSELQKYLAIECDLRQKQYEYYREELLNFGDEVEWRSLGEVIKYEQPTNYLVKSTEYHENYKTPVLTAGKNLYFGIH